MLAPNPEGHAPEVGDEIQNSDIDPEPSIDERGINCAQARVVRARVEQVRCAGRERHDPDCRPQQRAFVSGLKHFGRNALLLLLQFLKRRLERRLNFGVGVILGERERERVGVILGGAWEEGGDDVDWFLEFLTEKEMEHSQIEAATKMTYNLNFVINKLRTAATKIAK